MTGPVNRLESRDVSSWDHDVFTKLSTPAGVDLATKHHSPLVETTSLEYHGPSSFLSICSDRALEWLRARVVTADEQMVGETAKRLALVVQRKSNFNYMSSTVQISDPDALTAWEYCQAFFDYRADTFFGIVAREDFERRLKAHFVPNAPTDTDPCWWALRFTIYAIGSRLLMSRRGYDSTIIHTHAWRYFEAAFSVHSQILFLPQKDLTGVLALTLMSFFAENILSSRLEYVLCSSAVRLAQALGLNRDPTESGNYRAPDRAERVHIWWALYCYEKHISMRDGQPSCIDDDDISCPLPQPGPDEDMNKFECFMVTIKYAQLSSRIYRNLFAAGVYRQNADDKTRAIKEELEQALYRWRDSLPQYLRPGNPIMYSRLPPGVHIDSVVYAHYTFYASLIAIHNQLPWTRPATPSAQTSSTNRYASECRDKAVSAARNIILATRCYDVELNTTGCLSFSYPMMAVEVLFVHILQNPFALTAQFDVALLDMAAGHFAKLDLATSMQLDVQFVRDLACISRRKIEDVTQNSWVDINLADFDPTTLPEPGLPEEPENDNLNLMEFVSDEIFMA